MKCKNCEVENAQGNQYCENCGVAFEKCPVCQKTHTLKTFCQNTGKNIADFMTERRENEIYSQKMTTARLKFDKFKRPITRKSYLYTSAIALAVSFALFFWFSGSSYIPPEVRANMIMRQRLIVCAEVSIAFCIISLLLLSLFEPLLTKRYKKKFSEKFPNDAKYLE